MVYKLDGLEDELQREGLNVYTATPEQIDAAVKRSMSGTREKGGAGSGNRGHAGIPGKRGGSQPKGESSPVTATEATPAAQPSAQPKTPEQQERAASMRKVMLEKFDKLASEHGAKKLDEPNFMVQNKPAIAFDQAEWAKMDMDERRAKWTEAGADAQDRMADAGKRIPEIIKERLAEFGERPKLNDNDVRAAVDERMTQLTDKFIHKDSAKVIAETLYELDDILVNTNASPELRHKIAMDAADALAVQDNEAMKRQLGDHGINHIRGNIEFATEILKQVPGSDTPTDIAQAYIANIYHDAGYLTDPAAVFLDMGHPRWGAENYNVNVRPDIEEAFGSRVADAIAIEIANHASTDINWEGNPIGTAISVADNLALFQKEKLPALFRLVPGNTDVLADLGSGKIDVEQAKALMIKNIKASDLSPEIQAALIQATKQDLNPKTPKFTLGMLGGNVDSFEWQDAPEGGFLRVYMRQDARATTLQKILDLGQAQFAKFAKTYHIDPSKSLSWLLKMGGRTLLETQVVTTKAQHKAYNLGSDIYRNMVNGLRRLAE